MPRSINSADSIGEVDSSLCRDNHLISVEESANQPTNDPLAIAITIGGRGIQKVSTSVKKGTTLISSFDLICISTPGHCS
jgi:hypothetical protein